MTVVSNVLDILSEEACQQPIYIRWENLIGGWDYWLFQWSQDSKLNTTNGQQFKQNVTDLSTATEVFQYYKKEGRDIITLFAENINSNELETIRKISLSPKVELLDDKDVSPYFWFTVLIDQTDIGSYKTENNLHSLSINIRLLEIQTQSN